MEDLNLGKICFRRTDKVRVIPQPRGISTERDTHCLNGDNFKSLQRLTAGNGLSVSIRFYCKLRKRHNCPPPTPNAPRQMYNPSHNTQLLTWEWRLRLLVPLYSGRLLSLTDGSWSERYRSGWLWHMSLLYVTIANLKEFVWIHCPCYAGVGGDERAASSGEACILKTVSNHSELNAHGLLPPESDPDFIVPPSHHHHYADWFSVRQK